ncbi:ribulose-phosphate 3-epimerase [Rathayibacter toxicus]|uniref:Ribulose-phosphate 3-epimerase n=1 Tax=Rathayibacter toxicus TaxID=145458 RepID=A0A0C5BU62_9MICO|nr:hypothetical protein [Rathayibacter toxicus]AJM78207.1 hypothetical protein TI83_10275 [Rathayibacter toxicus]ALS57509.1 hypothetical protein APU90_06790 [Rathayibacter toxicus]KKM46786.1 hypothetical protein VT73_01910 [Rathayibacter toxicus]PPG20821.1 hypothetical protein C5D15_10135 [Rathayibacter toxicus]PPG45925.1 hypothetical protein C5D16_10105 [Rathayibacter toxicus]
MTVALGPQFAVSVVCMDQAHLAAELRGAISLGIHRLHIDIIDPSFGNLGLPPETISDLRPHFVEPIDIHLMVEQPALYIADLVRRRPDALCVHQRILTPGVARALTDAAGHGVEVGLVLEPGEHVDPWALERVTPSRITVMSVKPGGAGRPFEPTVFTSLESATGTLGHSSVVTIEVDGAVGPATAPQLVAAGATQLVLGSTAFPSRTTHAHRLAELVESLTAYETEQV